MNHDERDNLWDLLGKARPVRPSPAFTQQVLRAVRMSEPEPEPSFWAWLRSGWNWAALTGAAAAVVLVIAGTQMPRQPESAARQTAGLDATTIEEVVASPDFAVIANLDLLLAMEDNDVWLEASLR
jgi:hypothetical protein